jgi:2-amino-4-hydroxy-6-hydroxymethyldihydropteridine diphosphokinase
MGNMTGAAVALVALGSNLGHGATGPSATVARAMEEVAELGRRPAFSRVWRSPAWPPGGPDYANAAMALEVELAPEALLAALHAIEARWGRERAGRWEARTLDLDLLAWDSTVRPDAATQGVWRGLPPDRQGTETPDRLILPHPRMQDRGFVLAPLAEVAAQWRHPLLGRTVQEMLDALPPAALEGLTPLDLG